MNSKIAGKLFPASIRTKAGKLRLGLALLVSNVFFFLLFAGGGGTPSPERSLPEGQVELQLEAQLLTSFEAGKKVLLIHRQRRQQLPATLLRLHEGRLSVLLEEEAAVGVLEFEHWEVLPFIRNYALKASTGGGHEIRY